MRGGVFLSVSFKNREISYDLIDFERKESLPSLSAYSAVFTPEGSESANDLTKKCLT
jgi:hypothetical protein